ncbi:uncharacterized protein LOC116262055 isoform X1 [Nymphaea colorata]|nr:uncharacterized protein LOC116262055 isoform X1 [Nymphaea colorata]
MGDTVEVILDYLRRHRFTRAEAALRRELGSRQDSNGGPPHPPLEDFGKFKERKDEDDGTSEGFRSTSESSEPGKLKNRVSASPPVSDSSSELIIKEVECGTVTNGSERRWKNIDSVLSNGLGIPEITTANQTERASEKRFDLPQGPVDLQSFSVPNTSAGLYAWDFKAAADGNFKNSVTTVEKFSDLQMSGDTKHHAGDSSSKNSSVKSMRTAGDDCEWYNGSSLQSQSWNLGPKGCARDSTTLEALPLNAACVSNEAKVKHERTQRWEPSEIDKRCKTFEAWSSLDGIKHGGCHFNGKSLEYMWSKSEGTSHPSLEVWKECSIKTVCPSPTCKPSSECRNILGTTSGCSDSVDEESKCEGERTNFISAKNTHIAQTPFVMATSEACPEQLNVEGLGLFNSKENHREELPQLPPVRLKSEEKPISIHWEEEGHYGLGSRPSPADNTFSIGSFLDVPVGQDINSSGGKKTAGSGWLSVSQGIAEDTYVLATFADGLNEPVDYPNEYWDSDEYEDDDDVGYMRQPIEDESWFLAHEIDYPSDNEKGIGHTNLSDEQQRVPAKDDDDQSFAEEDSYFSGEQYLQAKNIEQVVASEDPTISMTEMYGRTDENDLIAQYDGQLMDEEELNLMRTESVWQGFVTQTNELIMLGNAEDLSEHGHPQHDDPCIDEDQLGSVRSIGVGISSDAADFGSEVQESLIGDSSEGDLEYFPEQDISVCGSKHVQNKKSERSHGRLGTHRAKMSKPVSSKGIIFSENDGCAPGMAYADSGFSFPSSLHNEEMLKPDASQWPRKDDRLAGNCYPNDFGDRLSENCDRLATWRRKSSSSSSMKSSRDEGVTNTRASAQSASSSVSNSNYGYAERKSMNNVEDENGSDAKEEDAALMLEDEEVAAVQEQVSQIKAQEEEYETFNLKIVHRKNRTGFEEDKNFHVVLNSVIAGRYHVTEYLGSAAFSKAIQAHDLHTGMDVCVKIIKNNKDFFDQSLDEIKLLKFVNKHDPADKYHILRLYDYFYYREHLLIVCELLKANLYEFHKFNRESGGEVYFTMPRLQSITIQCLEAVQFLHGLGLIHCDLKPENILVKSYSRCEVKVIDLGSSCFETDHLCSYVQSRSYRAPEVILGLPYDKKIDIWSLGCILAELCTGNVLFQNDSPATLLARVIGIIGKIDQSMLAKGRETYKYFTKNHMLYERNQDTNKLEYLIPKKSSLRHRLPMADQGFVDFVAHLLEINPKKRPSATEALAHPWLSYPYEPISS